MKIIDQKTLADYLRQSGAKPFGYKEGELDCSRFVAEWLEAIGKVNVSKQFSYESAKQASDIIKQHGGIKKLAAVMASECHVISRGNDHKPGLGDVGIVKFKRKRVFAIATGDGRWACKTARGVVVAPMECVECWSISYKGGVGAAVVGSLIVSLVTAISAEAGASFAAATFLGAQVSTIVGSIVLAAASIGLQYALASLNKPKQDPASNQQVVRQAVAYRSRHYGTVKVGGVVVFTESVRGYWYEVVVTASGEIDSVVATYANDKELAFTNNINTVAPWKHLIRAYTRNGLDSQTAYSELTAVIPEWTANHKLNGLASFMRVLIYPGDKLFRQYFPSGVPKFRQVIRGAKVYDPRIQAHLADDKTTWQWSDNAGLCILDYLTHPDGYALSKNDMDMPSWSAFADLCDQLVPLKSGGFEKRYRLCGTYSFAEARRDVLRRMLLTCDAQIVQLANGKIGIVGGEYIESTVTITGDVIKAADWQEYRPAPERVNELKPIYVSASHDYQQVEAGPWQNTDSITHDGLISQNLDLQMVPSNGQAQRLAKIAGRRINSPMIGSLRCTLGGLVAFEERFIRIVDNTYGVDGIFIVDKFEFAISENEVVVNLAVTQVDPTDWDWDAATEEKDPPPIPPETESSTTITAPTGLTVAVVPVVIDSVTTGAQISVSWDASSDETVSTEVRYRQRIGAGPSFGPYQTVSFDPGIVTGLSGVTQNDGSLYEVQARYVRAGSVSEWSPAETVIATADPTPPGVPVGLSATGGAGQIDAAWTAPNSANFSAVRVYWNTSNSLTGATLVTTIYGAPSQAMSRTITGLSAGTKWVLVTAINGSGVASSAASASAVVI